MAQKRKRYVTPAGRLVFPYLTKPDTKFNKDGEYKTGLIVSAEDGQQLIEQLDAEYTQGIATITEEQSKKAKDKGEKPKKLKLADKPYSVDDDSGEISVRFKMKAQIKSAKKPDEIITLAPQLFGKDNKPLAKTVKIGGGSKAQVSFEVIPFFTAAVGAGITLRLQAVRVLELVEWGGGDAKSFGFGDAMDEEPDEDTTAETPDELETADADADTDAGNF